MSKITKVYAREILNSRGFPTVEVEIHLDSGVKASDAIPSGASTGEHEAVDLRDGNPDRYWGFGVLNAVRNVNKKIAPEIVGCNVFNQAIIDKKMIELDGTSNKENLGGNAILAVSLTCARAASQELKLPLYRYIGGINARLLPVPMANVINGGKHADNNIDLQEFMIIPLGADTFKQGLQMISEVFHILGLNLHKIGYPTSVGDEGGYAPNLKSNDEALKLIEDAIESAGYRKGEDIYICIDAAASEFYKNGKYHLKADKKTHSSKELINYYEELVKKYPIVSIEDGLAEDDWDGWQLLTKKLGQKIQIVGDDLFTTSVSRLRKGINNLSANSILIKPNQIGTLSETLDTIELAKTAGFTSIISHRSGETSDSFIADLAVACNVGQIKTGSICRQERITKYNRLLRIEEELGSEGRFARKELWSWSYKDLFRI